MRNFMDIIESPDDEEDAKLDREKRVTTYIRIAFARIGLPISTDGFGAYYDEDPKREAVVDLEDTTEGYTLKHLSRLNETGLADGFYIYPSSGVEIRIRFFVKKEIDEHL